MKKRFSIKIVLLAFLCMVMLVFSINLSVINIYAADLSNDAIENIYDETIGKFYFDYLNQIAGKAGYSDVNAMIAAVEGGAIKTSQDFGGATTVKFGKNATDNSELEWIPAYLSESDEGPVLTLWLASSNNIYSLWGDGTLNNDENVSPSANNYSTSLIRVKTLNNGGIYYGEYELGWAKQPTPFEYTASSDGSNPFEMFTTGQLANYIATPSAVSWQTTANHQKNDPLWEANSKGHYTPTEWLNDKLWLPSIYEVYDGSAVPLQDIFYYKNSLWQVSFDSRFSGNNSILLRSAGPTSNLTVFMYQCSTRGVSQADMTSPNYLACPALHLNLKKAVENAVYKHEHVWESSGNDGWEITKPATCTTDGVKTRVCTAEDCTLENSTETEVIEKLGHLWATEFTIDTPATCTTVGSKSKHCTREGCDAKTEVTTIAAAGHSFDTATWSSDENNHWHAATCGHTSEKGDFAAHSWDSGTVTKAATCSAEGERTYTCSVCKRTKTEPIAKIAHTEVTDPAVPATCTQTGKTEGKHCGVCNEVLIAQTDIPMLSHTWSTVWSKDGANHWHECTECGAKKDEAAHSFSWVVDTPATVTSTGLKHEECLCGERRNENTVIEILTCEHTDKVHHARVEATCMTAGNVEYWHCNDCGKDIDGSYLELSTTVISIDPDAHSYINYVSDNNATCTADGTKTAQCAHGCGKTDTVTDIGSALGHDMGEWEVTKEATYTEDGEKRRVCSRCDHYETEVIPKLSMSANEITLTLGSEFEYGDEIAPVVSANYGEPVLTWLDESGAELSEKPTMPGSYKLKASVAEDLTAGYTAAEKEVLFTVTKRKVTLAIDPVSSEKGDSLVEVTATVIGGSIVSGEVPYVLNCAPDKDTVGEYPVTWAYADGFDEKYEITCDGGVYIVSKNADDPNGGGEIDLPVDINVEFKVTQSSTNNNYSELEGMKCGYWAQLWYRNDDGTLGDEFTENINCILTLKIPNEIIEAIRGGEEINRDKIAEGLSVYYINGNGQLVEVENFKIAQKEDESWIIKFNYNEKFRAEVVFNAAEVSEQSPAKSGTPWWVWLIVGLAGAAVIGVVIVLIVVAKKKNAAVVGGVAYDDAELKAKLSEQDKKLDEIKDIIDGGFNDIIDE